MGKPSWVSIILSVVMLGVIVWLIYAATHKTDTENYTKGASHSETTLSPTANYYPFSFGCSPLLKMTDPLGIKYPEPQKAAKK